MATHTLLWRAPATFGVDGFFKRTYARHWGDVVLFMKRSRDQSNAQGYHDQYQHDLTLISQATECPEVVATYVQGLKGARNLRCFKEGYKMLSLKEAEDGAVTSLQEGQYALVKKVGERIKGNDITGAEVDIKSIPEPETHHDEAAESDYARRVAEWQLERSAMDQAAPGFVAADSPERVFKRARHVTPNSDDTILQESNDPIERLLINHNQPMGKVLGTADWPFIATEDDLDIGTKFTEYYRRCSESTFKAKYPHDALALNATLLVTESPSPLQEQCFGLEFFNTMRNKMKSKVPDVDVKNERILIREWTDVSCIIYHCLIHKNNNVSASGK
ncbi:hypothetical protein BC939DRAFT_135758 [Gamsiella multidivaricata]|uniref:uncharacterized protein n=1 Tax=Gamsiella multidivaricata TaxID=101098 RepID=UPI00221F881D|nr:uncharacterized protein BC939DRAFT_135758 [Gamsiella multidivaricata]KAI7824828.1 hypothetical protein BC939DRAFT_135758 [Gamsiella multidivaricata]